MPVIPARRARKNAAGMIRAKPLVIEMDCAGKTRFVAVKNRESIMLIPANGMAVK